MKPQFAVKRGRALTKFVTADAAYWYWRATLGAALLIRARDGKGWRPLAASIPGTGGA